MSKKYIDVKERLAPGFATGSMPDISPDNIIFFMHYKDWNYDIKSEDMGHFLTVGYLDGNDVKVEAYNPEAWYPIKEFIEEVGDQFVVGAYYGFNKRMLSDLRIEGEAVIYKDKYRFTTEACFYDILKNDCLLLHIFRK